jgi:cobalt-precorrin-5B (C1)-methyltransferase
MAKGPKNEALRDSARALKTGFSTGSAATAAALAAAVAIATGRIPDKVEILLPKGGTLSIPIYEGTIQKSVQTVVVKDAGDDPDVTNQARIGVVVEARDKAYGLSLSGGEGVGRVTKPGLAIKPGEWAINPVPRRMLAENLAAYLELQGLKVEIFVKDGERLAQKTLNPRLGILGGLSILGTSGLVKPFSHGAYAATIESALSVAKALGVSEAVLSTGGRSEDLARKYRPDLPEEAFVQIADFFQAGLSMAAKKGFAAIGLSMFFGKAVKQAKGYPYTHAHAHDLDLKSLAGWLPDLPRDLRKEIERAPTALAALEILKAAGQTQAIKSVATKAVNSARIFTGAGPAIWAVIFDFDGTILATA